MKAAALGPAKRNRAAGGGGNRRTMGFELGEESPGAKGEDPAVPGIIACGEELLGARAVRLFDELRNLRPGPGADGFAAFEIAEAGLGRYRLDPEADQPVVRSQFGCGACGCHECRAIGNVVIARANQHHRILRQTQRGQRDRRRSVARRRLDDHVGTKGAGQLRFDMFEMLDPCDHHRRREMRRIRRAQDGRLKQRIVTNQRQERLGLGHPAARPEPGAAAAAKDDWGNLGHASPEFSVSPPAHWRTMLQGH